MEIKQETDVHNLVKKVGQYKIELMAGDDELDLEQAEENALDDTVEGAIFWDDDIYGWLRYFGIAQVNEALKEQPGSSLQNAIYSLLLELVTNKYKEL